MSGLLKHMCPWLASSRCNRSAKLHWAPPKKTTSEIQAETEGRPPYSFDGFCSPSVHAAKLPVLAPKRPPPPEAGAPPNSPPPLLAAPPRINGGRCYPTFRPRPTCAPHSRFQAFELRMKVHSCRQLIASQRSRVASSAAYKERS